MQEHSAMTLGTAWECMGSPGLRQRGLERSIWRWYSVVLVRLLLLGMGLGQFLNIEEYLLFVEEDWQEGLWPAFSSPEDTDRSQSRRNSARP